jgi:hypothetical protein
MNGRYVYFTEKRLSNERINLIVFNKPYSDDKYTYVFIFPVSHWLR